MENTNYPVVIKSRSNKVVYCKSRMEQVKVFLMDLIVRMSRK